MVYFLGSICPTIMHPSKIIGDKIVNEGAWLNFTINSTDADGDGLILLHRITQKELLQPIHSLGNLHTATQEFIFGRSIRLIRMGQ